MASEIDQVSGTYGPLTQVPDRQPDESTGPVSGAVADPVSDPVADTAQANTATSEVSTSDSSTAGAPEAERRHLVPRRTRMVPIATFEVPSVIRPIAQPEGWTDVLTGTDGPRFWDRIVLSEQARVGRYDRPVTVAFAEIVGLADLAGQWGWDVAERALAACARRLGREIRSSDHIARLEQARFGILLTETTEIAAINFVERARASCERELNAVGNGVPNDVAIGFGWASPPAKGDLSDAIDLALTRLGAELAVEPAG